MNNFSIGIQHKIFNNEIRKRRQALGLNQKQFAEQVGISIQFLRNFENFKQYPKASGLGGWGNYREETGKKIAEYLQVDFSVLFPEWLTLFKPEKTTFITEHQIDERILAYSNSPMMITDGMNDFECSLEKDVIRKKIHEALNTLSDREKKVLEVRFGIDGNKPKTLREAGAIFGVTQERIRQIEAKAFRKLRHPTRKLLRLKADSKLTY